MDHRSLAHAQTLQRSENIRIESSLHLDGVTMHDTEFAIEPAPGAASRLVRPVEEHPVQIGALVVDTIEAGRRDRLGDGRSEQILCVRGTNQSHSEPDELRRQVDVQLLHRLPSRHVDAYREVPIRFEGVAGRREGRSQIRFADNHTPMTPLRTIHRHILHTTRTRGVSVALVAESTRSFEQTMLMPVSGESNPASFALDDLIGIGGFDTWSADLATAPLPANVTDVIVLGQDGRPTLPLTPYDS